MSLNESLSWPSFQKYCRPLHGKDSFFRLFFFNFTVGLPLIFRVSTVSFSRLVFLYLFVNVNVYTVLVDIELSWVVFLMSSIRMNVVCDSFFALNRVTQESRLRGTNTSHLCLQDKWVKGRLDVWVSLVYPFSLPWWEKLKSKKKNK